MASSTNAADIIADAITSESMARLTNLRDSMNRFMADMLPQSQKRNDPPTAVGLPRKLPKLSDVHGGNTEIYEGSSDDSIADDSIADDSIADDSIADEDEYEDEEEDEDEEPAVRGEKSPYVSDDDVNAAVPEDDGKRRVDYSIEARRGMVEHGEAIFQNIGRGTWTMEPGWQMPSGPTPKQQTLVNRAVKLKSLRFIPPLLDMVSEHSSLPPIDVNALIKELNTHPVNYPFSVDDVEVLFDLWVKTLRGAVNSAIPFDLTGIVTRWGSLKQLKRIMLMAANYANDLRAYNLSLVNKSPPPRIDPDLAIRGFNYGDKMGYFEPTYRSQWAIIVICHASHTTFNERLEAVLQYWDSAPLAFPTNIWRPILRLSDDIGRTYVRERIARYFAWPFPE